MITYKNTAIYVGTSLSIAYCSVKEFGIVTYVGKYGFTVTTDTRDIPVSFSDAATSTSDIQISNIQNPVNPTTNKPCSSIDELRKFYPEYFL